METRWVRIHSAMRGSVLTKMENKAKHLKAFLLVLRSVFASQLSSAQWKPILIENIDTMAAV